MTETEIFELLGKAAAWMLSSAGAAFLMLQFGAQKWIENKFSKELETFKAQKLHEFNLLLNKEMKRHQVEHDVLPTCWKKLKFAHNKLKQAVGGFREISDLNRMSEVEFDKFLGRSDLTDNEKDFLQSGNDKNGNYIKILDHRDLIASHKAFLEFNSYFEENSIFLSPDVKKRFSAVDDYIWKAWVSKKMSLKNQNYDFDLRAFDTEKEHIAPLIKEIELLLQEKLFPDG